MEIFELLQSTLAGVPQGSHLRPLLFPPFVYDIPSIFNCSNCLLFTDDLKLLKCTKPVLNAAQLQRDLENLSSLCSQNYLDLKSAE